MASSTKCPVCQEHFEIRGSNYWPWWKDLFNSRVSYSLNLEMERSATLRCPNCGCTHVSDDYLFFGLLNRRQMLYAVLVFVLIMAGWSFLEQ